jgi:hypothetical protein
MTMTGRFVAHGIRILAAEALLVAVMSSPIRATKTSDTAPPPNYLPRTFAIPEIGHSGQFAMSTRPALREENSLPSDIEDELDADIENDPTATSPPAQVFFDVLPSLCPKPYNELNRFAVALAARPLRC